MNDTEVEDLIRQSGDEAPRSLDARVRSTLRRVDTRSRFGLILLVAAGVAGLLFFIAPVFLDESMPVNGVAWAQIAEQLERDLRRPLASATKPGAGSHRRPQRRCRRRAD